VILPSLLTEHVGKQVATRIAPGSAVLVGLSGGVDSVVLLHLLKELAPGYAWNLSALHVDHGISPKAGAWADFCAELCGRWRIPLKIEKVDIAPLRQHGIEAAARSLRHAAFSRQSCDVVALAHHADDQVETLLLQLLRGAGVRGAAAMPVLAEHAGSPKLLRPLLSCSREDILAYAREWSLRWIDDESNADDRYPRNYLRNQVLPLLERGFPAYRDTLTRSASHFAEASELLDELARADAGDALVGNTLQVAALRRLPAPRARNLLRHFLHVQGARLPRSTQLVEMLRQLSDARTDSAVSIRFGDHQVRRFRDVAYVLPMAKDFDQGLVVQWQGEASIPWPPLSASLHFVRAPGIGLSLAKLRAAPLTFRLRCGAEKKTLKNLLQQYKVPPWRRERMPLLFCGERLVCVVGYAMDADFLARESEDGVLVSCE
jgi:tRNA(Ile)-lysidine synthase